MHWSDTFYARQAAEAGVNTADIHPSYHALATCMTAHLGGPSRLLELGAAAVSSRWPPLCSAMT